MLEKDKLSSRFIKVDENNVETQNKQPTRFILEKSQALPLRLTQVDNSLSADSDMQTNEEIQDTSVNDFSLEEIEIRFKEDLTEKIDSIPVWFDYTTEKQRDLVKSFVDNKLSSENIVIGSEEKDSLIEKLFTSVIGFGPLDYFIAKDNVDAIFVNGINSIHIEIGGKVLNTEMCLNEKQLNFILGNISNMGGTKFDNSKNIWNLKLDNLSITILMPSISKCGVNISIRKLIPSTMNSLIEKNMMTKEIFDFLVSAIDSKKNIVISGEINSGKTMLVDALINSTLLNKRVVLLEKFSSILSSGNMLMKFISDRSSEDYFMLTSHFLKMAPEHVIVDFNCALPEFSEISGGIYTLRAANVDSAISKLVASFASEEHLSDKYAKTKVYSNYDYIVQLNKCSDGINRVTSIVELTPARTAALSVKVVAKFVDGNYVSEIPQPLTSIRADSLISEAGSMSARFSGLK